MSVASLASLELAFATRCVAFGLGGVAGELVIRVSLEMGLVLSVKAGVAVVRRLERVDEIVLVGRPAVRSFVTGVVVSVDVLVEAGVVGLPADVVLTGTVVVLVLAAVFVVVSVVVPATQLELIGTAVVDPLDSGVVAASRAGSDTNVALRVSSVPFPSSPADPPRPTSSADGVVRGVSVICGFQHWKSLRSKVVLLAITRRLRLPSVAPCMRHRLSGEYEIAKHATPYATHWAAQSATDEPSNANVPTALSPTLLCLPSSKRSNIDVGQSSIARARSCV